MIGRFLVMVAATGASLLVPIGMAAATTPPGDEELTSEQVEEYRTSFTAAATAGGHVSADADVEAGTCSRRDDDQVFCYGLHGDDVLVGQHPPSDPDPASWNIRVFVDASTVAMTSPEYPLDQEAIVANAYGQGIDVSGCPLPPSISEPITVDCPVVNGDGSEGIWTVTVNMDNSVSGTYAETKAATIHVDIDARTWALIARDPDAHVGELYRVYGHVTQADSATGTELIRANVDGVSHDEWYDYEVNTILSDVVAPNDLANVVAGDLFVAEVTVVGSFTYDTQIGGSTTVPLLAVDTITVVGHAD